MLALVAWLASINLLVLVFNLHPRLPPRRRPGRARDRLEGHRRPQPRDPRRRPLGQGFSYLFIALGILLLSCAAT